MTICLVGAMALHAHKDDAQGSLDPAAWGGDHVGQPVPAYDDGNTCLFCHRTSIGPTWQTNKHATTIRAFADDPNARQLNEKPNGAQFVLGRNVQLRILKRTGPYGTLALWDTAWSPTTRSWTGETAWSETKFGANCAGCHTSGVDSTAKTFQLPSLDCHTCHGLADPEHTEDGALMPLSMKGKTRAEVEISICGSCHLRGGESRSTGRPYPNNFVPGDNLFKDFEIDWTEERIGKSNSGDAHIAQNVRDVALFGRDDVVCTSCHDVHAESTEKHKKLPEIPSCFLCHVQGKSMKAVREYERHSETCEY